MPESVEKSLVRKVLTTDYDHDDIVYWHNIKIICLLEDRVLYKEAWVAKPLVTHLRIQDHKKVKFPGRDILSLAVKELRMRNFLTYVYI